MGKRVEQHSCFLNDVLKDVLKGNLVPAAFQRPYVWSKSDVVKMCESILEGYPCGTFLIWMPRGTADLAGYARSRLGPIVRADTDTPTGLLLDGQNRLASFAWMTQMLHEMPRDLSGVEQETWGSGETLVADFETETIRFVPLAEANSGFTLPAYALLDYTLGIRLIRERFESPGWARFSQERRNQGLKWWDTAQACFHEARVISVILDGATPEEARKAFTHICKAGVPMSLEDFDAALNWKGPTK